MDRNGELLPRFIAGSPRESGRKLMRNRYGGFRLEVAPSDRDLKGALAREDWRIVCPQASRLQAAAQHRAAELKLN